MGFLNKNDYEKILNYYNLPCSTSDSYKKIKNKAEQILAEKLCKCIKKVKNDNSNANANSNADTNMDESRAIAICNDNIFRRKGIRHGMFSCKNKPRLLRFSGKKYSLVKRSKYLSKKQKLRRQSLTMKKNN
jgi:hypothetical protein